LTKVHLTLSEAHAFGHYRFSTLRLSAVLAASFAVAFTLTTRTLHSPGGATVFIAFISGKQIHDLGFLFAILRVGIGAMALPFVAVIFNNLCRDRRYPEYWL
jgi:CBS-domain-containing membrane protein